MAVDDFKNLPFIPATERKRLKKAAMSPVALNQASQVSVCPDVADIAGGDDGIIVRGDDGDWHADDMA